jgi:hypothetical protein
VGPYNKRSYYEIILPQYSRKVKTKKISVTPNFTTMVTGHGNIKAYLHKYRIEDSPICSCKRGEQTLDHVMYNCKLFEEERDRLKVAVMRTDRLTGQLVKIISSKILKRLYTIYELVKI